MKKIKVILTAVLIAGLLSSFMMTAFAEEIPGQNNRNFSNLKSIHAVNSLKASPDSLVENGIQNQTAVENDVLSQNDEIAETDNIFFRMNGKKIDKLSFYMKRDSSTNQVKLPDPAIITVYQKTGQAVGEIDIIPSPYLNEDRERVQIKINNNNILSPDTPVTFTVTFVDKNIGDEYDKPSGGNSKSYIQVTSEKGISKKLNFLYGADGFYTHYSSEYKEYYKGAVISKKYVNVGEVNLNKDSIPTFTIEHYYKPLTGAENAEIKQIQLNPDGQFTFEDNSYTINVGSKTEGWISIPMKMKTEVFQAMKKDAASKGEAINIYSVLSDLVIAYNDGYNGQLGYMAGGAVNPLPIVYHVTYKNEYPFLPGGGDTSNSSGGSSSSGSSGGSGSSSSSGGSSGSGGSSSSGSSGGPGGITVTVPLQSAKTTVASVNDIGWVKINDVYLYMDAEGQPVTDWLLADGKWYYLGSDGIMRKGWTLVDGKWYLLNQDGSMAIGLIQVNQQWYLLNQDGSMATGWHQDSNGNWRYFLDTGIMAIDYITPDGYYINTDGFWIM